MLQLLLNDICWWVYTHGGMFHSNTPDQPAAHQPPSFTTGPKKFLVHFNARAASVEKAFYKHTLFLVVIERGARSIGMGAVTVTGLRRYHRRRHWGGEIVCVCVSGENKRDDNSKKRI